MTKKLILGPILTHLAQIWAANIFLDIVTRYHPIQFKGKLRNQTWENGKKLILGLILARFGPNSGPKKNLWILRQLDVRHYCKISLYWVSKETNEPNLRKWAET